MGCVQHTPQKVALKESIISAKHQLKQKSYVQFIDMITNPCNYDDCMHVLEKIFPISCRNDV